MAYAVFSVVFGEQPSAAKWNILGTNDASFNDGTGFAAGAIGPASRSGGFYGTLWDASGLGTGTGKTITGIGFTPKALVVLSHAATSATGSVQSTGYCYYNGATYVQGYHASGITTAPAGRTIASATQAFGSTTQATTQFVGAVTGFSSDTVTINITTNAANTYCQFNVLIFA